MVAVATPPKRKRKIVLSPKDNGRRMSLDDFTNAEAPEGQVYELNKGVIEMGDVPSVLHALILDFLRGLLYAYRVQHPDRVCLIAGGTDSKVLGEEFQSERHPDMTIYLTPPPEGIRQPWSEWIPEIVIEVVSESSSKRDYEDKPPEYARIGIKEYWLVDPFRKTMTVNTRWRGVWKLKTLKPGQSYETRLLPGFKLDVRKILNAGK